MSLNQAEQKQLNRIETKLDSVMVRSVRTEVIADTNRGWIKVIVVFLLGIVGALITATSMMLGR